MLAKCWMKLLVPFAVFANISPTFGQHLANKFYKILPRCQMLGKCWANVGQHYQTGLIMLANICPTFFDVGDAKKTAQINQHLRPNILPNKSWQDVGQMLVNLRLP